MPKKVLIVDDSPTVRQQVGLALKQAGFEILEATDGADGLAKVGSDPSIGMVILDVNMPRMNGLEMLEAVKAGGANAALPVIMLTSEGQQALVDRAKKAGAKGWIVKPFKAELLVAAVKKLLPA
ncbi:MAG: chemotaxis protein CheY [Myxococcaceae bacterium]|nr:chemotaxis protein CheY [Myxococcaceae bacterium]